LKLRLLEIGRVARAEGPINQNRLRKRYRHLLNMTSRVVGQARRYSEEIAKRVERSTTVLRQLAPEGMRQGLDEMCSRVRRVMKQTRAGIFRGNTRSSGMPRQSPRRGLYHGAPIDQDSQNLNFVPGSNPVMGEWH
jgi:transposase, IS5 family